MARTVQREALDQHFVPEELFQTIQAGGQRPNVQIVQPGTFVALKEGVLQLVNVKQDTSAQKGQRSLRQLLAPSDSTAQQVINRFLALSFCCMIKSIHQIFINLRHGHLVSLLTTEIHNAVLQQLGIFRHKCAWIFVIGFRNESIVLNASFSLMYHRNRNNRLCSIEF